MRGLLNGEERGEGVVGMYCMTRIKKKRLSGEHGFLLSILFCVFVCVCGGGICMHTFLCGTGAQVGCVCA